MTHALADLGPRVDSVLPGPSAAPSSAPSASGAAFAEAVDAAVVQAQREARREPNQGDGRTETASRPGERGAHRDEPARAESDARGDKVRGDDERRHDGESGRVGGRGHRRGGDKDREQPGHHGARGAKDDALPLMWAVMPHTLPTVTTSTGAGHRHATDSLPRLGGVDRETTTGALAAQRGTRFHFTHDARLGSPTESTGTAAKAATTATAAATAGPSSAADHLAVRTPVTDTAVRPAVTRHAAAATGEKAVTATGSATAGPGTTAAPAHLPGDPAPKSTPASVTAGTAANTATTTTPAPAAHPAAPATANTALPATAAERTDRLAPAKTATTAATPDTGSAGASGASAATAVTAPAPTSPAAQAVPPVAVHVPTVTGSTVNSAPVVTATPVPTPPVPLAQPDVAAILAQLRGSADGTYQLRARVHPAELGAVSITATVQGGTLHVLLSPDQTAQQAISQSLPQLRAHLADQGFTGVDVGLGSPQQSPGRSGQGEHGERGAHTQGSDHTVGTGRGNAIDSVEGVTQGSRHRSGSSSALDRML